jgi:riboflavin kinase / FMN adenylyltransferase
MKVHNSIDSMPPFKNAVVATGLFDGVHIGHKALISTIRKISMETGGESVLISFDPHPAVVFNPDNCNAIKYLNTTEEKIKLLSEVGIDHLVLIKFTREFASLSAEEYVRDYICGRIGAKKVLAGYNHHFGKAAEGDNALLKNLSEKYQFDVVEIKPELIENELVSNSVITKSLSEGNVMRVNAFLGYSYHLSGEINAVSVKDNEFSEFEIKGIDCYKMLPAYGRYATRVVCSEVRFECLAELIKSESGDAIKIYLRKDVSCPFEKNIKLYFYKNLRLWKADDDGYYFRTRSVDQVDLEDLLF